MNLKDAIGEKNFNYFMEISKIPRPSFHEERIADYVEAFLKNKGLWYRRDAIHNIIAKVPGTAGREAEAPLVLQAHMDMVCNKEAWSSHDFSKDPIEVLEEDGWLRANGTTLGADDGAGVANLLGLLDEEGLSHPPLECIFTVQEEDGMGGAKAVDLSELHGKRMIGLDGILEGSTIYSASDVWAGRYGRCCPAVASDRDLYRLKISGLSSGHGALLIGSQRANAIKLTARLLRKVPEARIASLHGGGLIHVIPAECETEFYSDRTREELMSLLGEPIAQIRREYAATDPGLKVELTAVGQQGLSADAAGQQGLTPGTAGQQGLTPVTAGQKELTPEAGGQRPAALSAEDSSRFLDLLILLPVGAQRRNAGLPEQVEGSFNLSIASIEQGRISFSYVARTNQPVSITELKEQALLYAKLFGYEVETIMEYPGYSVPVDSALIRLWNEVYEEDTGKALIRQFIHSALDAGAIFQKMQLEDLIVVMPTTPDVHTPKERVSIDSFYRTYQYLKRILERC